MSNFILKINIQLSYQRDFNVRNPPYQSIIRRLVGQFQQTGSVHDFAKITFNSRNTERILNSTEEEQGMFIRRRSLQFQCVSNINITPH